MSILRLAVLAALTTGVVFAGPVEPKKLVPKFKLGKDTTFVMGPLDKDGYIDYEAALNERLKGKITPETNAVVLLAKCLGPKPEGRELHPDYYKALGIAAPPEKGEYLVGDSKLFREGPQNTYPEGHQDLQDHLRQRPWKPEDSPKHAEWLKLNEKPLAVAVEASKRKDYFHPMIARKKDGSRAMLLNALLPTVQKCRELGSLLSLRAMLRLGDGRIDDAFADTLAVHRLGRLVSQGGTLIELLVGIALQGIAHADELAVFEHGHPTAKQALAYQAELRKLPPMATVADKLQLSERVVFLDIIQTSRREGFDSLSGPEGEGKSKEEIERVAQTIDWELILGLGNGWYDKCEAAMRKATRAERVASAGEIVKALRKMKDKIQNMSTIEKFLLRVGDVEKIRAKVSEKIGMTYVSLLIPAFQLVGDAADRAEQIHRNGLLAAALAAHFADHQKYPDKLADLAPKYIGTVPDDIFSAKPLVYMKTDAGYLLYSVGVNGKDDGGKLISDEPRGDEPRGDDVGVRMPRM